MERIVDFVIIGLYLQNVLGDGYGIAEKEKY